MERGEQQLPFFYGALSSCCINSERIIDNWFDNILANTMIMIILNTTIRSSISSFLF